MIVHIRRSMVTTLLLSLALLAPLAPAASPGAEKVSSFGAYEGWSTERFDEWVTTSRYVEMRDGVRLAVDVTRPAVDGIPTDEPFPVVWTHSRYHRNPSALARVFDPSAPMGDLSTVDQRPDLQRLVRHGYVFGSVGVRGSGASFGRFEGLFSPAETEDAVELCAWFAAQPWCDGNVGMWGGSYLGITQYMAASKAPPALKAIFPDVAAFDLYELLYPGGVFREDLIRHWDDITDRLDADVPAPPVDGDDDGALLAAAVAEHADNWQVLDGFAAAPFRDDVVPGLDWDVNSPSGFLDEINAAGVPCYHYNGWFDVFVLDALLWFANYEGPQRAAIGPWSHAGMVDPRYGQERMRVAAVEQHRWFDRWLKGIENGVMDEPPLAYALMIGPGEWRWELSETWPPAGVELRTFHFDEGPSGTVESVNDGRLCADPAEVEEGVDEYSVDPTTTTGTATRWDNAVGAALAMDYPGLAENDRRSLTYTSAALAEDLAVVGHPIVRLFVNASHRDADFVVVLEEVDTEGAVHYVTEGVIRGSHRALSEAPWDNLGLPFQRGHRGDPEPLPVDRPAELVFDLHPTANLFDAGHRLRVALFCRDADNLARPPHAKPENRVHVTRGPSASRIELPILLR